MSISFITPLLLSGHFNVSFKNCNRLDAQSIIWADDAVNMDFFSESPTLRTEKQRRDYYPLYFGLLGLPSVLHKEFYRKRTHIAYFNVTAHYFTMFNLEYV